MPRHRELAASRASAPLASRLLNCPGFPRVKFALGGSARRVEKTVK
jgi:hypothetical protein